MALPKYTAFIRLFGANGHRYFYSITDSALIACRRMAKQYVGQAVQYQDYDGGYIAIRLPAPLGHLDAVEVEQWAFTSLENDGCRYASIWRSDLETIRKMEYGGEKQEVEK